MMRFPLTDLNQLICFFSSRNKSFQRHDRGQIDHVNFTYRWLCKYKKKKKKTLWFHKKGFVIYILNFNSQSLNGQGIAATDMDL